MKPIAPLAAYALLALTLKRQPEPGYHNARYMRIAEEVGLDVDRDTTIGWSLTALPHATATTYAATIEDLQRAITLHRRSESSSPGTAGNSNLIAAVCDCHRRIRVGVPVRIVSPAAISLVGRQMNPRRVRGRSMA